MYERKIPIDFDCGVSIALEVIISKWSYCILSVINEGVVRPKDMIEVIPDVTKRVLLQQLKRLEFYKIVDKITYSEVPPKVEYSLTEEGRKVLLLLEEINNWGLNFAPEFRKIVELRGETHKSI